MSSAHRASPAPDVVLLRPSPLVFEYRVTKYDPAFRDASGAYRREEWTSFGDVGGTYGGEVLTEASYRRVEDAYVCSVLGFWREVGKPTLIARGVEENGSGHRGPAEGSAIDEADLAPLIRAVLREEVWCRLESETCFLHFGWDYYAYVGVSSLCVASCALAAAEGLFVEVMASPHHPAQAPGRSEA